jgi:uncharacterized phage protein gp47/JayE
MSIERSWKIDACGCCRVPVSPTPEVIWNRPGLPAIGYRVGTYSSFRRAMIERISSVEVEADGATLRPLRGWTTRASDDYGVALLEMWAYVADILTFYQERTANEAFLRTALFRESVLRLAALLDYEPAPGVAATTHLAFTLEKDKKIQIPVGLRVQSVPGQGEKPQKFETVGALDADARLNQLRIFPEVETDDPLAPGRRQAFLRPDGAQDTAAELVPADRLVILTTTDPPRVEEKVVEAVEFTVEGTNLVWSPAVQDDLSGGRMLKWQRQFRLFGYNAPQSYLKAEPVASDTRDVRWTQVEAGQSGYRFDLDEVSALKLDALYDDLKVGTWVLVAAPDAAELARIESIREVNATKGPLNDTVTEITLTREFSTDDLRTVTVYELAEGYDPEEGISLWHHKYAGAFPSDTVYVRSTQLDALARGHVLILDDNQNLPQTVTCTGVVLVDGDGDETPDHLRITFTPALTRELDSGTAVLYGNVSLATHGETVAREVLGSGDASTAFQSFGVRKSPVTFVPQPGAPHGAANTLQVRVGGVLWHEVRNLYGRGGDERVYTTSMDNEGKMSVRFGDGKTGARPASGRDNVVAMYRQGVGRDGNVGAGSLRTLLDRPVGLRSATNPAEAGGGADPETLQEARANAPNTVRTFGRIVSLRDFEDAAREFASVAKARAAWIWDGEEQVVHLTVAGHEGDAIIGEAYDDLVEDLDRRRDPNRKLVVPLGYRQVPVQIEVTVQVHPDRQVEEVQAVAQQALEDAFAFDRLEFGQSIHLSDVYQVLQEVTGVVAVVISRLQFKEAADRNSRQPTSAPVQAHLRIDPGELACIDETDAVVNAGVARA